MTDSTYPPPAVEPPPPLRAGDLPFAAAFLDHGHIHGQIQNLKRVGATLRYVYDPDPAKVKACLDRNPEVVAVDDFQRILDDPEIRLVTAAAIPSERGPIGCQVMRAGKDYFTDKCPFTTLDQLTEARKVSAESCQRYWVNYGEMIGNEASWHAGELVRSGVIGDVVHMAIFGPHRLGAGKRVFLVTGEGEHEIDCKGRVYLPFYDQLAADVLNGTDTAMSQEITFLIAELSLQAQAHADRGEGA